MFPLRLFIKIYTCTRRLRGTLRLIKTWLLFGNIQYIYTPLYARTVAAMRISDSFAAWTRSGVCLLSALAADWTAARGTERMTACECFWTGRNSRQHPLLIEHSNCGVIRAFKSPNTTKVSNNTSKSRKICRSSLLTKKVVGRMICLCVIIVQPLEF